MNLQRIWADPVSFPWSNIWIISTHPRPRTKSRSIKSSTRWSANNTPSSNIRGRRLSISTSVPPATNFTAAWSTTSMIKTGSMAMICIPTPHRRCRTCTSSISWRGQKKKGASETLWISKPQKRITSGRICIHDDWRSANPRNCRQPNPISLKSAVYPHAEHFLIIDSNKM